MGPREDPPSLQLQQSAGVLGERRWEQHIHCQLRVTEADPLLLSLTRMFLKLSINQDNLLDLYLKCTQLFYSHISVQIEAAARKLHIQSERQLWSRE